MIETAVFTSPDGNGTQWRLLGVADTPTRSRHHLRLKFDIAGGRVLGWLVPWGTDEDVPLEDVRFDGSRLSMRLPARFLPAEAPARPPRLSLTLVGDREFRGYYVDELDARLEPAHELKLVRVADDFISL